MPSPITANRRPRSLSIVTAPRHYSYDGKLWSYGPYVKEIDLWANLFEEVRLIGPLRSEQPPEDCVAFQGDNIVADPVPETGGESLGNKIQQVLLLPWLMLQLARKIRRTDAVHIRSPASLALMATVVAPWLGRPMTAKYAGQWSDYSGERPVVRLQKWLLRTIFRGPVTVYGKLRSDPTHIVGFFTSMLSTNQIQRAAEATSGKAFQRPFRLLFAGRLYPDKGVLELIEAVGLLAQQGAPAVELRIVGDGPLSAPALSLVQELKLEERVTLLGAMEHHQALEQFGWANGLVLASRHEGWPKVLTEAMVHHCLAIAPQAGIMGDLIQGRGCALKGLSAQAIAATLVEILDNQDRYESLLPEAALWASQHSTEGLQTAISELLEHWWQTEISACETSDPASPNPSE